MTQHEPLLLPEEPESRVFAGTFSAADKPRRRLDKKAQQQDEDDEE